METFREPKNLVENPLYPAQRQKTLAGLSDDMIDGPIVGLINAINRLPVCFTLQSCFGHFVHTGRNDPHNLEPLPANAAIEEVQYRIAYICLCVQNNAAGKALLEVLRQVAAIDPENIQFGCAQWFWDRQVNSYVLQVQPARLKHADTAMLDLREALYIEKIRNEFFKALENSLPKQTAP